MKKSIELINDFYKIQKDFSYLKSVNISRDIQGDDCSLYTLNITLYNGTYSKSPNVLLITFENIRNLKIGNIEGLWGLLFRVTDISQDQMEGINYKVIEEENEVISFFCEGFYFEVI